MQIINFTKKYAKFGPKSQSTTKHCMFRAKHHASPENFTPALLVMLETFRRSALVPPAERYLSYISKLTTAHYRTAHIKVVYYCSSFTLDIGYFQKPFLHPLDHLENSNCWSRFESCILYFSFYDFAGIFICS